MNLNQLIRETKEIQNHQYDTDKTFKQLFLETIELIKQL